MPGRNGEPVDLLLLKGKKHLTKDEVAARREHEKSLQPKAKTFKANKKVNDSTVAKAVFSKLKKLYKDIDYVGANDEMIINRYCLMTAEIEIQETLLSKMEDDIDKCKEFTDRMELYKTIASAEKTLNKMRDMLLKIEDRLFLNPVSRMKNVPKKAEQQKEQPQTEKEKLLNRV